MSIKPQPGAISLADEPSAPPPPGVSVNFDTTDTRAPMAIAVCSSCMGLMSIFVCIRVYVKVRMDKRATWDDLTLALGVLSLIAVLIISILELTLNGYGKPLWDVPLSVTLNTHFYKVEWLFDWMAILPYIFIKLSFFLLYLQVFHPFLWFKICTIAGAVIVTAVYMAFIIVQLIALTPRHGQSWFEDFQAPRVGEDSYKISWPIAAWTLASDVYILVLPIAGISRLQISAKRRFAVIMVFMTGLGACICSSLSLYFRLKMYKGDNSRTIIIVVVTGLVELCVGVCICCMPATLRMLRKSQEKNTGRALKAHKGNKPYTISGAHTSANGLFGQAHQLERLEQVKAEVATGEVHDLSDDRIHLRFDMEQAYAHESSAGDTESFV